MKRILFLFAVSFVFLIACKKEGCTDVTAANFSAEAEKDDGSCSYSSPMLTKSSINLCGDTIPYTVKIGDQEWRTTNLNTTKFRNGDDITLAKNHQEWADAYEVEKPMCGYYDFDPSKGKTHGLLYNFFALTDSRGIAPSGYHVAMAKEWHELNTFIDPLAKAPSVSQNIYTYDNELVGLKLKSKCGWSSLNGVDDLGVNITPSGSHFKVDSTNMDWQPAGVGLGRYQNKGELGIYWCEYKKNDDRVWTNNFTEGGTIPAHVGSLWSFQFGGGNYGKIHLYNSYSIRCLKD